MAVLHEASLSSLAKFEVMDLLVGKWNYYKKEERIDHLQ